VQLIVSDSIKQLQASSPVPTVFNVKRERREVSAISLTFNFAYQRASKNTIEKIFIPSRALDDVSVVLL
jgi:hypothetical protein